MPRKESKAQTTHHRRVQREAKKLKDDGWNVRASGVRGYEEPGEIAGYVPDIIATKRGHTRIVEVETPETWESHEKQIEAFRRHAAQKPNTYFEEVITRLPKKK